MNHQDEHDGLCMECMDPPHTFFKKSDSELFLNRIKEEQDQISTLDPYINLDIQWINEGGNITFAEHFVYSLTKEKRQRFQALYQKVEKKLVKFVAWFNQNHKLHPARRRLYIVNEFSLMWLGSISSMQCGHCVQLLRDAADQLEEIHGPLPDYEDDLENLENVIYEKYHLENPNILKELSLVNYQSKPLWSVVLFEEYPFRTQYDDSDDGSGYNPGDLTSANGCLNEEGLESIEGPEPVVCWRFFKTTCKVCGYQVAPAPQDSQAHCLACYYFMDVLNQLAATLCKPECSASERNIIRVVWPKRKVVDTHYVDFNLFDQQTKFAIIYQEGAVEAELMMSTAEESFKSHLSIQSNIPKPLDNPSLGKRKHGQLKE